MNNSVSNEWTVETEQEREGRVWVLTIQGDVPEHLEPFMDEEEQDEFGGDIVGCYLTKELMFEDMKRMSPARFGIHHMMVEGLAPKSVQNKENSSK